MNQRQEYETMRDSVIISSLPYRSNTTKTVETNIFYQNLSDNITILYGSIWDNLQPNERIVIEHLHYENPALVSENSQFYSNIHAYIAAKIHGDTTLAKYHLKNTLWEVLHNSPYSARNQIEYDKAKNRRRAQAQMLNSLGVSTFKIPTPDYVIESIKRRYQSTPLEELLPDIVFPLEENARKIAREIIAINKDVQRQIFGKKSIVSESQTIPEAEDAFAELMTQIIGGVRGKIDSEIDKLSLQSNTEEEIADHVNQAIEHYQDTTIPSKVKMLASHFYGKLTELIQADAGYTHYIWHTQDDEKTRPSHAANDGKVFAWDSPPPTGHPGHDYNCRCYAEPVRVEPIDPDKEPLLSPTDLLIFIPGIGAARVIVILARSKLARRLAIEGIRRIANAVGKVWKNSVIRGEKAPKGGRKDTEWSFGKHKSDTKWKNQMEQRNWTDEQITDTIKYGDTYTAPNNIRKNDPNATATRYQKDGKFVVRDDQTKEILQVSAPGDFKPLDISK